MPKSSGSSLLKRIVDQAFQFASETCLSSKHLRPLWKRLIADMMSVVKRGVTN